jgi:hypothetical protein
MLRALSAFLDFCYLVRRSTLDDADLQAIDDSLHKFHAERVIFQEVNVVADVISLPRQHSLQHYHHLIQLFGAPNGLCSSITEAKHIKAVKEPWRRSSRNLPLSQMLVTNQRLDKLAAFRAHIFSHGNLDTPLLHPDVEAIPRDSSIGIWPDSASPDPFRDNTNVNDAIAVDDQIVISEAEVIIQLAKSKGVLIINLLNSITYH